MFYVYKFVILSIEIQSSIISMIIIVVVIVIVVMLIQVNLGQTCLQESSNMRQKIIYKQNINNL